MDWSKPEYAAVQVEWREDLSELERRRLEAQMLPKVPYRERVETATTCSACGKETTVPFKPTQGRPVFCKECFQSRKFAGAGGV